MRQGQGGGGGAFPPPSSPGMGRPGSRRDRRARPLPGHGRLRLEPLGPPLEGGHCGPEPEHRHVDLAQPLASAAGAFSLQPLPREEGGHVPVLPRQDGPAASDQGQEDQVEVGRGEAGQGLCPGLSHLVAQGGEGGVALRGQSRQDRRRGIPGQRTEGARAGPVAVNEQGRSSSPLPPVPPPDPRELLPGVGQEEVRALPGQGDAEDRGSSGRGDGPGRGRGGSPREEVVSVGAACGGGGGGGGGALPSSSREEVVSVGGSGSGGGGGVPSASSSATGEDAQLALVLPRERVCRGPSQPRRQSRRRRPQPATRGRGGGRGGTGGSFGDGLGGRVPPAGLPRYEGARPPGKVPAQGGGRGRGAGSPASASAEPEPESAPRQLPPQGGRRGRVGRRPVGLGGRAEHDEVAPPAGWRADRQGPVRSDHGRPPLEGGPEGGRIAERRTGVSILGPGGGGGGGGGGILLLLIGPAPAPAADGVPHLPQRRSHPPPPQAGVVVGPLGPPPHLPVVVVVVQVPVQVPVPAGGGGREQREQRGPALRIEEAERRRRRHHIFGGWCAGVRLVCLCPLVPKSPEKELYARRFTAAASPTEGDAKRIMIL